MVRARDRPAGQWQSADKHSQHSVQRMNSCGVWGQIWVGGWGGGSGQDSMRKRNGQWGPGEVEVLLKIRIQAKPRAADTT